MKLHTTITRGHLGEEDLSDEEMDQPSAQVPEEGLEEEAVEQLERDREARIEIEASGLASAVEKTVDPMFIGSELQRISAKNGNGSEVQQRNAERAIVSPVQPETTERAISSAPATPRKRRVRRFDRFRKIVELGKSKKTTRLILQIWQSDYSVIAFLLVMVSFYVMKDLRYPPIGVLFFLLAMATVDAILSIFVVRLSFHQNKHGFYRTEDFERDWLRYRILLSMTKAALIFIVGTTCGVAAAIASYIMWWFTSTQRLRYFILRWSMDDHYPDLQRWSVFALLREAGIEPKRKNFNWVAIIGVVIGFTIAFLF